MPNPAPLVEKFPTCKRCGAADVVRVVVEVAGKPLPDDLLERPPAHGHAGSMAHCLAKAWREGKQQELRCGDCYTDPPAPVIYHGQFPDKKFDPPKPTSIMVKMVERVTGR